MLRAMAPMLVVAALAAAGLARAQDRDTPREFAELRGTWTLDEKTTEGVRVVKTRTGQTQPIDPLGLPLAWRLTIATTPTEITVSRDDGLPEVYRLDGSETQTRDPRTNVPLAHRYSFTLVAGMLALTSKLPRDGTTEIVTDAFRLTSWDVLTVERQLSYVTSDGRLRTLSGIRNHPQTIVYRRS